ncbi:MAG: SPOR domain-containing protein [Nitrospinae bacterium]|nr:SPOR domain-containing protein [Nitrospinota bacterium]
MWREPACMDSKDELIGWPLQRVSSRERSLQQMKMLEDEGFTAFWKKVVIEGRGRYIIYVGPFDNLSNAKINQKALKYAGLNPILLSVSQFE